MPYNRSRRRRSSSSRVRRNLGHAWKRIWKHVPEGVAAAIAFAIVLLIGLALLPRGGPRNVFIGVTACSIGAAGLVWQAWLWWRRIQEEGRRREAIEEKTEVRRVRRQRNSDEQAKRQRRSAADAAAHVRAKDVQHTLRRKETDKATAEKTYRRGRDDAIARDALRLLTMSEIALLDAAAEAFETRGFIVGRDGNDARRDMLLRGEDGDVRIVARLAPLGRKVDAADVDALDAWRGETGAAAGILIGIAGFTPDAVRRASTLPATLAEAYLLAQWRVGGALGGSPEAEGRGDGSGVGRQEIMGS